MIAARGIASQSFAALWVNPGAFAGVKKMVAVICKKDYFTLYGRTKRTT